jgi:hypothetical protein
MKQIFTAKGVGGIFDHLARPAAGEQDRRLVDEQRAIDLVHHLPRPFILGAHHDAVGALEIADGRALAQEFGVGGHREFDARAGVGDDAFHLVARAHRNGGFGDDHAGLFRCSPTSRPRHARRKGRHGRRRGGWGAHRDEDRACALDPLARSVKERRPAFTLPATSSASPGS